MMTSLQFLHTPLPDLDTYQLLTQSDLWFLHNWTVQFGPLSLCHVTHDDVIMTWVFGIQPQYRLFVYAKFD